MYVVNVFKHFLHKFRKKEPEKTKTKLDFYKEKGILIGDRTYISPDANIDFTRPSLVTIGSDCYLNKGFTLLTHDFVTGVFRNVYKDFLNSSGKVVIGNNVHTGHNVIILKGVTIGDNSFIGANSLVTHSMPPNSIIVGSPAKVIYSIQEYYEKRLTECEEEAFEYARSIQERFNRSPQPEDFWEEFHLFVDASNITDYPMIPIEKQLGNKENYVYWLKNHKAKYCSFDTFLKTALKK